MTSMGMQNVSREASLLRRTRSRTPNATSFRVTRGKVGKNVSSISHWRDPRVDGFESVDIRIRGFTVECSAGKGGF